MSPAEASKRHRPHDEGNLVHLTIMGTSDLHGSVFNWNTVCMIEDRWP
jgi:2',3'-cyclic-nucleotide 2'-phosphodiesterase (5'-nucleotidase family)